MPDPSTIFWTIVVILAGLAVLAVLLFVIVWAILGIRRELARSRARTTVPPFVPSSRYWPEHSAVTRVDGIPLVGDMIPPPAP